MFLLKLIFISMFLSTVDLTLIKMFWKSYNPGPNYPLYVYNNIPTVSKIYCAITCQQDRYCSGFNYTNKQCILYNSYPDINVASTSDEQGIFMNTRLGHTVNKNTWIYGRTLCQADGGDMMIVTTPERHQLFYLNILPPLTYVGGFLNSTWQWLDGTPLESSFWYPGQPDLPGEAFCLKMKMNMGHDAKCYRRDAPSVCEIKI